jgi:hypothetical protein
VRFFTVLFLKSFGFFSSIHGVGGSLLTIFDCCFDIVLYLIDEKAVALVPFLKRLRVINIAVVTNSKCRCYPEANTDDLASVIHQ